MKITSDEELKFYRGKSMKGTFKPGDLLSIKKISFNSVDRGDVIVFKSYAMKKERYTVHRVIGFSKEGIITKGDNNRIIDEKIVTKNDFIGKVVYINRSGEMIRVAGGIRGLINSKLFRMKLHLKKIILFFFAPPYGLIKNTHIFSFFLKPPTDKIWLLTKNGLVVKFLVKKRVVAKWYPERGSFFCKKPFDLVIRQPIKFDRGMENLINKTFLKLGFSDSDSRENMVCDDK